MVLYICLMDIGIEEDDLISLSVSFLIFVNAEYSGINSMLCKKAA